MPQIPELIILEIRVFFLRIMDIVIFQNHLAFDLKDLSLQYLPEDYRISISMLIEAH